MSYVQRRRFLLILFIVGIALIAIVANATTLSHLKFDDLALQSTAVARLRCLGNTSQWEQGEIWTETRFAVVEQEKGSLPGIVTVRLLGGMVGHLRSQVDEVPAFRPGEEVYLFLWGGESQPYSVLGWSQGTFRIARETQTGIETVTQDSAARSTLDLRTRQFRRGGVRSMSVEAFSHEASHRAKAGKSTKPDRARTIMKLLTPNLHRRLGRFLLPHSMQRGASRTPRATPSAKLCQTFASPRASPEAPHAPSRHTN